MTWVVGMPALLSRGSSDPLPSRWRALYRTLSGQEGRRGGSGKKGGGEGVGGREEGREWEEERRDTGEGEGRAWRRAFKAASMISLSDVYSHMHSPSPLTPPHTLTQAADPLV